jgi:hypothetical protein
LIFMPIEQIYTQNLERITLGQDGREWEEMGAHSQASRIVWTIVESTMPWLANGVFQHLSDKGKNHLCKDGRENYCNR